MLRCSKGVLEQEIAGRWLEIDFGPRHWLIAFIPGTHELLLNGQILKPKTEFGYQRWNPETSAMQMVKGPVVDFRFDAFLDVAWQASLQLRHLFGAWLK
jgi:hypothetical protein